MIILNKNVWCLNGCLQAYCALLYFAGRFFFFFKQIEGLWQAFAEQVYQCLLSNSMCLLPIFVSFLVIFVIFQTFIVCYGDLSSGIFDVTIAETTAR